MSTPITVESLTAALREAVAERGKDWVYPDEWRTESGSCQYFRNGEPACLWGYVMAKHGYSPGSMQSDRRITSFLPSSLPGSVLKAANRSQYFQDHGHTWGEALAEYERTLRHAWLLPDDK